jgi:hypothetical protein
MRRAKLAALALAGTLAVTSCAGTGTPKPPDGVIEAPDDLRLIAALEPFDACDDFLTWVRKEAAERVGPYGLGVSGPYPDPLGERILAEDVAAGASAAAPADGEQAAGSLRAEANTAGGGAYSTTNTVEAGVDEPDIVKTDGTRIVTINGNTLRVIDPRNGTPKELGRLQLGEFGEFGGASLLLAGDKALVLGQIGMAWRDGRLTPVGPDRPGRPEDVYVTGTKLTEIDLADPASPKVLRTLIAEGGLLNARMVGDTARIVVSSTPSKFDFLYPSGPRSEERAKDVNRQIVAESTVDQWLPGFVLEEAGTTTSGRLVACEGVYRPADFAGFSITSVLTVDLGGTLTPGNGVAVVADGQQVYASPDHLYVSVNRYQEPGDAEARARRSLRRPVPTGEDETAIHKFSIKGEAPATYLASGTVRGHLMNDFSLSEFNGNLRVATTDGQLWGGPVILDDVGGDATADEPPVPESFVTVLAERGDQLVQVGQVGGLGRNERIYGVRFHGPIGYVVTFRQVDPLYTLDLSDPTNPTVRGELKILGYSAYLHPLPGGRLLGVGADATEEGRRTGVQVSVFDVSDLSNPQRTSQVTLPEGFSDAENDYKAFLYWEPTGLVTVPVSVWGFDPVTGGPAGEPFVGMLGFSVAGDQVREAGRISHPASQPACNFVPEDGVAPTEEERALYCPPYLPRVLRSVVIGDLLYTFSEAGMGLNDLTTLTPAGFLAWT